MKTIKQELMEMGGRQDLTPLEAFNNVCARLTINCYWSFDQIVEAPIPYIMFLTHKLIEQEKEMERQRKKNKRR